MGGRPGYDAAVHAPRPAPGGDDGWPVGSIGADRGGRTRTSGRAGAETAPAPPGDPAVPAGLGAPAAFADPDASAGLGAPAAFADPDAPAGLGAPASFADPDAPAAAGHRGGVIRAVGAVVFDDSGRLLVIQRGHDPGKGLWSVPGGKVEPGETDEQAVEREIAEETGLLVRVGALLGTVVRGDAPGPVFEIADYDAVVIGTAEPGPSGAAGPDLSGAAGPASVGGPGSARAADDADDLRWVTRAELDALPLTEGLIEALTAWDRLPR